MTPATNPATDTPRKTARGHKIYDNSPKISALKRLVPEILGDDRLLSSSAVRGRLEAKYSVEYSVQRVAAALCALAEEGEVRQIRDYSGAAGRYLFRAYRPGEPRIALLDALNPNHEHYRQVFREAASWLSKTLYDPEQAQGILDMACDLARKDSGGLLVAIRYLVFQKGITAERACEIVLEKNG